MNKSETIGALAKALSKVQSELRPAAKDSANPFFKSKYADLNSVWDSCRELLTENGLSVVQTNQIATDGVIVETILLHSSGQYIGGELFLPLAKSDPQGVGSAITYGRRYGLAAIVGIVADEDDDGNATSKPPKQKQNDAPMPDRILKAQQSIRQLGGEVEARVRGESDEAYLASLTEQYKRLKAAKG